VKRKKRGLIGKVLLGLLALLKAVLVGIIALIAVCWLLFSGIELLWKAQEYKYYAQEENFVEVTGEVEHLAWNEEEERVAFSLTSRPEGFVEATFDIEGDSFYIVADKGGAEHLKVGAVVTFMAAPRYFGDGYIVPAASLTVDGVELLSFEEGYENLLGMYRPFS